MAGSWFPILLYLFMCSRHAAESHARVLPHTSFRFAGRAGMQQRAHTPR